MDCVGALRTESDSLAVGHEAHISDLPGVAMEIVAGYSDRGHLGGTSKLIRATTPVRYKIDASDTKYLFLSDPDSTAATYRMGLESRGAGLPLRVVKAITITGCYHRIYNDIACVSQIAAFRRLIAHAIPTLSSITLEGGYRAANMYVSALLSAIAESGHVAPFLLNVRLSQSPSSVHKALNAIAEGLWPALQVLELPHCHTSCGLMTRLASAIREGGLRDLRALNWNNQGDGGRRASNLILEALSTGGCPKMEVLSFTKNPRFDEMNLSFLGSALQACTELRELHMDCAIDPRDELQQLTKTITSGNAPALELIHVNIKLVVPSELVDGIMQECKSLREAGKSNLPVPVEVAIVLGKKQEQGSIFLS